MWLLRAVIIFQKATESSQFLTKLENNSSSTFVMRYLNIRRLPLKQASCNGVDPLFAFGFISLAFFDKILKTAKFPLAAAQCNGVSPFLFTNSGIRGFANPIKYLTISVCPLLAAKWTKVLPSLSIISGSWNQGTRKKHTNCTWYLFEIIYSRLRIKHRATFINFWNFFQGLHPY